MKLFPLRDVMSSSSLECCAIVLGGLQTHPFQGNLCNRTKEIKLIPSKLNYAIVLGILSLSHHWKVMKSLPQRNVMSIPYFKSCAIALERL
jgi:hypothetical protein